MALVLLLIVKQTFFSFCFVFVASPSFSHQAAVYGRAGTAVAL